jgi:WD40 repeat protein
LSSCCIRVLFLFTSAAIAQERGPLPRELDRNHYPLPPGAIARIGTPPALTGFASSLAWSADGKQFVAADWDGVTVFDAATGRRMASMPGLTDARNVSAPLMRDGRTILRLNGSAGSLVDIESGEALFSFTLPSPLGDSGRRLYSLNVSANHRFLGGIASESSMPGVAWRYDLARNRFVRLVNDRADLQSMRLSPDGKRVYATGGTSDPELTARTIGSDKELWTTRLKGSGTLRAISADGKRLVVSDMGGLSVFDSAHGNRIMTRAIESQAPPGVWGIDISPDGKMLALADGEHVFVWETSTAKLVHRFDHSAKLAAFSPDAKSLLTASAWVQRWNLSTGKPVFETSLLDRPTERNCCRGRATGRGFYQLSGPALGLPAVVRENLVCSQFGTFQVDRTNGISATKNAF